MDTQEKIVRAALKQMQLHGFIAATTKSIAAEAGVAEVTLFRYFGDKKTLFAKVAELIAADFGVIEMPEVKTGDLRQDAALLCQGILRHFIQYNRLFRVLIFESAHYEDIRLVLRDIRAKALHNIQTLIHHYADSGGPQGMQRVEWLGNSLMGASLSYCMFHAHEDQDAYIVMHAGLIATAFVDAILAVGK